MLSEDRSSARGEKAACAFAISQNNLSLKTEETYEVRILLTAILEDDSRYETAEPKVLKNASAQQDFKGPTRTHSCRTPIILVYVNAAEYLLVKVIRRNAGFIVLGALSTRRLQSISIREGHAILWTCRNAALFFEAGREQTAANLQIPNLTWTISVWPCAVSEPLSITHCHVPQTHSESQKLHRQCPQTTKPPRELYHQGCLPTNAWFRHQWRCDQACICGAPAESKVLRSTLQAY